MVSRVDFSADTVCISGTYGCGKSKRVCDYLLNKNSESLLVVCYRISQGLDFTGKLYANQVPITFYSGHTNSFVAAHKNRLVISTQSLQKICPLMTYDTVVIDEATSLLIDASISPLVSRCNMDILFHIIANCKKLVLMDVNLTDATMSVVSHLRQLPRASMSVQRVRHSCSKEIVFEGNRAVFISALLEDLCMGRNVVFCSDSRKCILQVADMVPDKVKKRIYTNGHPYAEDLQNVDDVWTNFQFIAYSPSITTATSFTRSHFHTVYGLFTYTSLTAREFAQQLHRVRNVSDNQIIVHSTAAPKSYLRNLAQVDTVFDPAVAALVPSTSLCSQLQESHNKEVHATYQQFERQLLESLERV